MEDTIIIEQFWERSESAISSLRDKYAKYCHVISFNILGCLEDTEEILNEAYFRLWNALPPERPKNLRAYLGKVVRNLSLNRLEKESATKRGSGQYHAILFELEECITDTKNSPDSIIESVSITDSINSFLDELDEQSRCIFVRRYWYVESIEEIAKDLKMQCSSIKTILFRTRKKLKIHLESEEIYL